MPVEILSQNIVDILLLLGDGDINLQVEEIIHRVERFEQVHNRHFGISQYDFRNLFRRLFFDTTGAGRRKEDLSRMTLGEIIPEILRYHEAYFNDEGEYWITLEELTNQDSISGDDIEIEKTIFQMELNDQMRRFFENAPNQEAVRELMGERYISEAVLFRWSRKGKSS